MPLVNVGKCATTGKDIELFYDTFGEESNDPMVLIMGLGSQMIAWTELWCKGLTNAGYYVIRFDNRDVGLSTHLDDVHSPSMVFNHLKGKFLHMPPHFAYTLDDMANDTLGLIDALGLTNFHLMGASLGGMVAQLIAIKCPERVKSMCCIMSTTGEPELPRAKFSIIWQLAKSAPKDREKCIEHTLDTLAKISSSFFFDRVKARPHVEEAYDRSDYQGGVGRQMAAILAAPGRRKQLKEVKLPCLVIHGREDKLLPFEHAEDLYSCLSDCSLHAPDQMAHDLPEPLYNAMMQAIIKNAKRAN